MKKLLTMIIIISLAVGCASEEIKPLKKAGKERKYEPGNPNPPEPKGKD